MRHIISTVLLISTHSAKAQIAFQYDQPIPVRVGEVDLTMPWAGGTGKSLLKIIVQ